MRTLTGWLLAVLAATLPMLAGAEQKPTLTLAYMGGWDDSVASSNVAASIIRNKLGYPLEMKNADIAMIFSGVARGDIDFTLSAWLPATHAMYLKRFGDKIEIVGTNYAEGKIGLAVPDYMDTRSIADLGPQRSLYRGEIVGIDPGAGQMQVTEKAIKDYGLNYNLISSSGVGMTVALGRAIRVHKPIVVAAWSPHWMFAKWKLHFLEDPKGVFGGNEEIKNVIHPGLDKKAPEVVAFLKKFAWQSEDIQQVMLKVHDGADVQQVADEWVAAHPEQVAKWLE